MVELTRDHVRYALAVASRIPHPDPAQRDSDALFALLMASRSYDADIGTFLGYAGPRIVWAIRDGQRRADYLSRQGRRYVKAGEATDPGSPMSFEGAILSTALNGGSGSEPLWPGKEFSWAAVVGTEDVDRETRISVQDALAALDTRGGLVVRLRYHDWPYSEIEALLGVSTSRVSQLYRAGLDELRAALGIDSSVEMLAA